ncbi:MAG TPA: EAL domain-containing protein [Rhodocyclaceae bacterium]|nr:EAL domain-containing protein [Rhodocyclaceae bacterium]
MFPYDGIAMASILGTSLDAVFTIDQRGIIVDLNPAAVRMFGWSREEFLGANISMIVPSPLKERHDGFLRAFDPGRGVKHVLGSGQRLDGERKDGSRFPVEVGISSFVQEGKRYFTGFVRDMSERQRSEDQMRFLATHDTDTGLLNYRGFAAECVVPGHGQARVVVFRLEEFRRFSLVYGEPWCATTLRELALRLQGFLGPGEVAARVREDTFAILMPQDFPRRTEALAETLRLPFTQGTMHFSLTATIGISRSTGSLDRLLRSAQWACDRAGAWAKGAINEFTDELYRSSRREFQIETRLRDAVGDGALSLALQPKVRLADGRIAGAEALVRWTDPELGTVPPAEFVPIAERLGLVGGITDWILRQSLAEISRCADPSLTVAVNFSTLDFYQPHLVQHIGAALSQARADPARLVVELTESVLAHDVQLVDSRMGEIKALGAALSLDDFGTGYSSLGYLRQFPIDSLKIDISFVRDLPDNADAVAIATAIVAMAKALGLDTIAEGIENERQAGLLRALGVDQSQGYLFSRPVPPAEFHRLVEAQGRRAPEAGYRISKSS